jgi:hypothetical protein
MGDIGHERIHEMVIVVVVIHDCYIEMKNIVTRKELVVCGF